MGTAAGQAAEATVHAVCRQAAGQCQVDGLPMLLTLITV